MVPPLIVESAFRPAWWLPGPHLQTLWAAVAPRRNPITLQRERVELPDGDFVDLDWTTGGSGPIVLILHGLEGSSRSPYAAGLLKRIHERGWRGAVLHARGCSGEPNRLARRYHAGDTGDLDHIVKRLRQYEQGTPLAVVGYSLGGSVLLHWLAEAAEPRPVAAAVAVSVPFDLNATANRLERGFSRIYQYALLRRVCRNVHAKHRSIGHPLAERMKTRFSTFREFDDAYTAPLHGFDDVDDYYRRCSCRGRLKDIATPTLIIQSRDDPFLTDQALPTEPELSDNITLELSEHGGHVGFIAGSPLRARNWLEDRISGYLESRLRPTRSPQPQQSTGHAFEV